MPRMEVFISWSGEVSYELAASLKTWLPLVLPSIKPWLSKRDISPGKYWEDELQKALDRMDFGILCLTPESCSSPWVLFEAGALAKKLGESVVVPYLLGADLMLLPDPMRLRHAVIADKTGTQSLVEALFTAADVDTKNVETIFDQWWPRLELVIKKHSRLVGPALGAEEFLLRHVETGNYLTAQGDEDRSPIILSSFERNEDTQVWRVFKAQGAYCAIINKASGRCIDVAGHARDRNKPVWQYKFGGGDNQMWAIACSPDHGCWRIRGRQSGRYLGVFESAVVQTGKSPNDENSWLLEALLR